MHTSFILRIVVLLALLSGSACAPAATSTPFIPPAAQELSTSTSLPSPTRVASAVPETPSPVPATDTPSAPETLEPTPAQCSDDLSFVQDLTIPDGSIIQPGAVIEKEWLVTNSGSCNWDASYRLKLVGGDVMGATAEQALYPARAGTQVPLRIVFTAPLLAGIYQSAWQAYSPDGIPFGDAIYITINVGF